MTWTINKESYVHTNSFLSSNFHELNGVYTFTSKSLGFCTLIPFQFPGEQSAWLYLLVHRTDQSTMTLLTSPVYLFHWHEKAVGWHMVDLPQVPTLTDLAGTQTHDTLIIGLIHVPVA